jgi:hypothetical protein
MSTENNQGRIRKTYQDRIPAGQRDRVHEWDRRRSWAQTHKPRCSSDWLKYRG